MTFSVQSLVNRYAQINGPLIDIANRMGLNQGNYVKIREEYRPLIPLLHAEYYNKVG